MLLSRIRESLELFESAIENRRLTQLILQRNKELKKLNDGLGEKVAEQTQRIREQHQELKQSFMETIKSFASLLELRHKDMGSHCQRVATVAKDLIGDMGLGEKESQDIFVAALLHDVGKIALPDDILRKDRDSLNKTELVNFARHTIMGQSFVYQINGFEEIGIIIRHHHEDYAGGGFPDGLVEKKIPLGSRVIRVADAFDHTTYRQGFPTVQSVNEAMAHLVQFMGMKYDPDVVRRFVEHDFAHRYIRRGESEVAAVRPGALQENMVVAADVYTKNGMFLLPKGAHLSSGMIKRLIKIDGIDPIENGVEIYRKEETRGVTHAAV